MELDGSLDQSFLAVQSLLSGRDETTIDKKGRLLLPKAVRIAVGNPFVLMIGKKGCLEATSNANYLEIWAEINRYSKHSDVRREYALEIMGNSFTGIECEETGRFVVPAVAREKANLALGSDVIVISAGDVAEIWTVEEFKKYDKDRLGYNAARRNYMSTLRRQMIDEGAY